MTGTNDSHPDENLFVYRGDGADPTSQSTWRKYSSVCTSDTDGNARIIWAGPTEFWTITTPSTLSGSPWVGADGTALCHFKDDAVVGSYSTRRGSSLDVPSDDPYWKLSAGACSSADDCWFGGVTAARPGGTGDALDPPVGSFHLHWDGTNLKTVYAPAKRGVSDIVGYGNGYSESVLAGPAPLLPQDSQFDPVPAYSPIQSIANGASLASGFSNGTLSPAALPDPDNPGHERDSSDAI